MYVDFHPMKEQLANGQHLRMSLQNRSRSNCSATSATCVALARYFQGSDRWCPQDRWNANQIQHKDKPPRQLSNRRPMALEMFSLRSSCSAVQGAPSWAKIRQQGRRSWTHLRSTNWKDESDQLQKPIGEVGCCESGMAEESHWWTEKWLKSPLFLFLSLFFSLFLYLSLIIYRPTYWSICLSIYLPIYLSIYLSISLSIYLPIYLAV